VRNRGSGEPAAGMMVLGEATVTVVRQREEAQEDTLNNSLDIRGLAHEKFKDLRLVVLSNRHMQFRACKKIISNSQKISPIIFKYLVHEG
jgi:hypothetical protein